MVILEIKIVILTQLWGPWAAANLAELAWHVGSMVDLPNKNIVPDLMGHPVTDSGPVTDSAVEAISIPSP